MKLDLFFKLIDMIETESKKCGTKIIYIDRGWYDKIQNSEIKNQVFKKFNHLSATKELIFFINFIYIVIFNCNRDLFNFFYASRKKRQLEISG